MLRVGALRSAARFVGGCTRKQVFNASKGVKRRFSSRAGTGSLNVGINRPVPTWLLSLVGVGVIGTVSWWVYWPHNPFPASVAAILRKALWAESNKENFNYGEALKLYISAVDECDKCGMDNVSDEYTGVELKVAEMYEMLGMSEEANVVYMEILYRLYEALKESGRVPDNERPNVLRRDLRVLIKSLETNKSLEIGKRNLLAHLLLAQEEILARSPELKDFFDQRRKKTQGLFRAKASEAFDFKTFVNTDNIKLNDEGHMILDLQRNSTAWEPFKEEFFTARDLYTAYCLSSKDLTSALSCKMTTVEWMVMADMPPGQILLSQANLGSLLYLQSEKFESDIHRINTEAETKPEISNSDKTVKTLRDLNRNKDTCLQMAQQCYDSVVQFAKKNNKLRFNLKDQLDPSAAQAIALSTYGLGVLNLHQGVLAKAEKLLNDSIIMAKDVDFVELINEAEHELEKVEQSRAKR